MKRKSKIEKRAIRKSIHTQRHVTYKCMGACMHGSAHKTIYIVFDCEECLCDRTQSMSGNRRQKRTVTKTKTLTYDRASCGIGLAGWFVDIALTSV